MHIIAEFPMYLYPWAGGLEGTLQEALMALLAPVSGRYLPSAYIYVPQTNESPDREMKN